MPASRAVRGRASRTPSSGCLHRKVCWAQERRLPGSAITRTSFPGSRRPVPPTRRALGLTSGLLLPLGTLVIRATPQLLLPPPPHTPSAKPTLQIPQRCVLEQGPFSSSCPPPLGLALATLLVTSSSSPPLSFPPLPPALASPFIQPLSPALSSPSPSSPPTAATSWFEGANGRAPPGVSYLHHVGEGGKGAGR